MTTITKINQLATEAADPFVAGEKMRQVYFAQIKLTTRQLTVDFLKKILERKVGTHEVESLAQKVVKGEGRRNPEIVATLLKIKLKDAIMWAQRLKKKFLKKKAELYESINRAGLIKEMFWTAVKEEIDNMWRKGKDKMKTKMDRLERIYKGARPDTGMVGDIRVGDMELGAEEDEEREPLVAGTEVNQAEAKVLNLDPRFRDWNKITLEEIETDIDVGLDNARREINTMEENEGRSLTEQEENQEKQFTRVLDHDSKTADFGKMRATAMKLNRNFVMSGEVNRKDELRLQRLKDRLMDAAKEVVKKTNDKNGFPNESCFTEEERRGIKSLVKKKNEGEVVVCGTDKSQASGAMTEAEWLASLQPHTAADPVVTRDEVDLKEREMTGITMQLSRALRMGEGHGQGNRIRDNIRSEGVSIPNLTAKIKDHKEVVEGEPVKVRAVCGAEESPNGQLSNVLSEVINVLTQFENKYDTECKSSEEMRAGVKQYNAKRLEEQQQVEETEEQRIIGSTDFKAFYQNMPVTGAAAVVRRMAETTELDVKTDDTELALFLASTLKKEEVERLGLKEVVHTRLHNHGASPGITSIEILSRGPACPSKWRPPSRPPTEEERRKMMGIMLETSINICMDNHFYMLGGEVKRQASGAGTGLRLSEALGRAYGLDWDRKLVEKLANLGWTHDMIKRYVDDLNAILKVQKPGTRYNHEEEKLEIVEDQIEEDREREVDEITMKIFGDIANSIDPAIQVEIDFPSKKPDKMMPILDMKMTMDNNNMVKYKFYRKPQSNKYTMMERSALSSKTKRSTLTSQVPQLTEVVVGEPD